MATIYGVIAIILWGGLALLGTITVQIPAFQLLMICFVISTLLIVLKRLLTGVAVFKKCTLTAVQWIWGVIGLFGFHFFYFLALKYAPAIEVCLIVYLWPLLLALFVATRQTILRVALGSALGFVGIAFVIIGDLSLSVHSTGFIGYLLAIGCAFIWSGYSWFLSKSENEVEDIAWLSAVAAILSFVAHLYCESNQWDFTMLQWGALVLLGLGPVGGSFYLWDIGLKFGNKALLASLSFAAPLISSIALSLAGFNTWSLDILVALVLILAGALIANMKIKHNLSLC